ncbi:GPI-anchored wall transfer protein 1-like [Penaeus japonicus]|uniref:GPI-anchored wall transfer protein 1-like n=1 Tax=Penaeus japonicus TaxID=27405 RepID=UPI001C71785B|nr:GPI-anchored wall transfer protein 1-like [Penaeus japonicus]XP_042872777.1 GPI-anchored wall transfer protein 1-like [Penaeus japonicus]XP_042872778.1 GPI-anchored wall transfer protein 1-like [Penaeus japonicus]
MNDSTLVREAHEAFVTGHTGSTAIDVILAIFPVIPASLLAASFVKGRIGWLWFFIDSFLLVVPPTLGFTVLANYTLEVSAVQILLAGLALLCSSHPLQDSVLDRSKHLACLTAMRAILNVNTAVAILGVDFHSFPRRFAKTEEYGYSVMDVGAGGFVVVNGFVEGRKRRCYKSVMIDAAVLAILGLLRVMFVQASDYQQHVTEYGVHGNFFFTLAFIKATCSWWVYHLTWSSGTILATLLCLCHHILLTAGNLGSWTLSNAPRDNLLTANREWIVSMPGYMAVYFFGTAIGNYIFKRREEGKKLTAPFLVIAAVFSISLVVLGRCVDLPSRRLGNPTFVTFVMTYTSIGFASFSLIEETLSPVLCVPPTLAAINRRPLTFFLLTNLTTGLINKCINTLNVEYPYDVCIISCNVVGVLSVVYSLYCWDLRNQTREKREKLE